jgi:hypothetical protein
MDARGTPTTQKQQQQQQDSHQPRVGWTVMRPSRTGEVLPVVGIDDIVAHMKTWREAGPEYVNTSVHATRERLYAHFGISVSADDVLALIERADDKWHAKQRPTRPMAHSPSPAATDPPTTTATASSMTVTMRTRTSSTDPSPHDARPPGLVDNDAGSYPSPLPRPQPPSSFLSWIRRSNITSRVLSMVGSSNDPRDEAAARLDDCEEQPWNGDDGAGEEEEEEYEDDDDDEDAISNGVRPYIQRGGGFVRAKGGDDRVMTAQQELDMRSVESKLTGMPVFSPNELCTLGQLLATNVVNDDVVLRLQAMYITMKMLKKAAQRQCTVVLPRRQVQNQFKRLRALIVGAGRSKDEVITFLPYAIDTNSNLAKDDDDDGPPLMMEERTTLVIHIKW